MPPPTKPMDEDGDVESDTHTYIIYKGDVVESFLDQLLNRERAAFVSPL